MPAWIVLLLGLGLVWIVANVFGNDGSAASSDAEGYAGPVGSDVLNGATGYVMTTTTKKTVSAWADWIEAFEKGPSSNSPSVRNNNPGNIRDAAGNFIVFPTYEAGRAALEADLAAKVRKYPNFSLLQIMTRYLGGNPSAPVVTKEGNPFTYAQYIAERLGVSVNDTLSAIFGGNANGN